MISAIVMEGVSETITSSDPHYAIWALACTTVLALVGQILTYLKASQANVQSAQANAQSAKAHDQAIASEAGVQRLEVKVDGALTEFIKNSTALLEVTKGAKFAEGVKSERDSVAITKSAVDLAKSEILSNPEIKEV